MFHVHFKYFINFRNSCGCVAMFFYNFPILKFSVDSLNLTHARKIFCLRGPWIMFIQGKTNIVKFPGIN